MANNLFPDTDSLNRTESKVTIRKSITFTFNAIKKKRNYLIAVCCLFLTGFSFAYALYHDHQSKFLNYRYTYFSIPVAVSYLAGHPKNYAGYRDISEVDGGNPDPDLLKRHPDLTEFNDSISKMISKEPKNEPNYPYINHSDYGVIDLTYWSFFLLGPKYQNIFIFVYILLIISQSVFLLRFIRHTKFLIAGLAISAAFLAASQYGLLMTGGKSGISDPASFGILVSFAVLHIACELSDVDKVKLKRLHEILFYYSLAIFQVFFIVFFIYSRQTVLAHALPIFVFSIYFLWKRFGQCHQGRGPVMRHVIHYTLLPVILVSMLAGFYQYRSVVSADFYAEHNHHPFWHNVRFGFAFNEKIASFTGWPYYKNSCFDAGWKSESCGTLCEATNGKPFCSNFENVAFYTVNEYLKLPDKDYDGYKERKLAMSPGAGFAAAEMVHYERVGRDLTLRVMATMPMQFSKLVFVDKPRATFEKLWEDLRVLLFFNKSHKKMAPCVQPCQDKTEREYQNLDSSEILSTVLHNNKIITLLFLICVFVCYLKPKDLLFGATVFFPTGFLCLYTVYGILAE